MLYKWQVVLENGIFLKTPVEDSSLYKLAQTDHVAWLIWSHMRVDPTSWLTQAKKQVKDAESALKQQESVQVEEEAEAIRTADFAKESEHQIYNIETTLERVCVGSHGNIWCIQVMGLCS